MRQNVNIAIVAGETSGDNLGAGLIREFRRHLDNASFEGIGGPAMQAEGMSSLYPMEKISIMGLDGLVRHLREILNIRANLVERFSKQRPDIFVGIDVPDFNLGLEYRLRAQGIKTIHYVSPTVWAWRSYRVKKIRRSVDHMLTLFPFEADFYRKHNVPVTCVGHPIADQVAAGGTVDTSEWSLDSSRDLVAVLPGSRRSEIERLGPVFAETASRLIRERNVHIVVPSASEQVKPVLKSCLLDHIPAEQVRTVDGNARQVLRRARVALLASGTAALESALVGTPMVVAYKISLASYLMVKAFSNVEHYSMPNHLLEKATVPEFMQADATADNLFRAVCDYLDNDALHADMRQQLNGILNSLCRNADVSAANAVMSELALSP